MSVYIPGMEMPTSCWRCMISQLYEKPREMLVCKITHEEVLRHKIDRNCPLVYVPEHGRLIDANAFISFIREKWDSYDQWFVEMLKARPTIIPADKEGEG